MTDAAGNPITKFASGTSAIIEMTVPAGITNPETGAVVAEGDSIPVFVFNETTGDWIVEKNADGTVKRTTVAKDNTGRLFVRFTTTHLTWFNLDWKGTYCSEWGQVTADTPTASIVDRQGKQVSGAKVHFDSDSGWAQSPSFNSGATATFMRAPADIEWRVWAEKDGVKSDTATIKACKEKTTAKSTFTLVIGGVSVKCATDAQCDDANAATRDKCVVEGLYYSYCVNTAAPNQPPAVTATSTVISGAVPLDVRFTGTCIDADGVCSLYYWNFGEGSSASGTLTSSHTYNTKGSYVASFTATDDDGATSTATAAITVYQAPAASIDPKIKIGAPPLAVDFTATCTDDGSCVSYLWNFGDGTPTNSQQNPSHIFTGSGEYIVSLTVTDNDGHTSTALAKVMTRQARKLTLGVNHACAITPAGGVKCWGRNGWGQLGNGTFTDSNLPVVVSGLSSGVIAISAGGDHTCALTNTGGVKCWGFGGYGSSDIGPDYGLLGNGTDDSSGTPVDVAGLSSGVVAISAGISSNCALTSSGAVKCWGYNYIGQLGDGTKVNKNAPAAVYGLSSGVVSVTVGDGHACAITSNGGVKCWGYNALGQVGDGTTADRIVPVDVLGLSSGVKSVFALGQGTTCAFMTDGQLKCWGFAASDELNSYRGSSDMMQPADISIPGLSIKDVAIGSGNACVLTSGSGVKCWGGINNNGQLGNGGTNALSAPVDVIGLSSGVDEIQTGGNFSCAMTTAGGIKCWGNNTYGQLGNGLSSCVNSPANIAALSSGVAFISAGYNHACVIDAAGGVKCWGVNQYGQLGSSGVTESLNPVSVTGVSGAAQVFAGSSFSYAITGGGALKAWGYNNEGDLGDGTNENRNYPVDIMGDGAGATFVSPGGSHNCAVVDSGVRCWGANDHGQLGDGTIANSLVPVNVYGISAGATKVAAGYYHTCAIVSGGVKCWGYNKTGELGNGTVADSLTPVDVSGLGAGSGVVDIATGAGMGTCVVVGGRVKCWGNNGANVAWDSGEASYSTEPVEIAGVTDAVKITTAITHSCILTSGGGVKCWGFNAYGELGIGSFIIVVTPTDVVGLTSGVSMVAAGNNNTCAIVSGALKCWGSNEFGLMGTDPGWTPVDVVGF